MAAGPRAPAGWAAAVACKTSPLQQHSPLPTATWRCCCWTAPSRGRRPWRQRPPSSGTVSLGQGSRAAVVGTVVEGAGCDSVLGPARHNAALRPRQNAPAPAPPRVCNRLLRHAADAQSRDPAVESRPAPPAAIDVPGTVLRVVGWGAISEGTSPSNYPHQLQEGTLPLVDPAT